MAKTHFFRSTAALVCALGLAACGGADADIDTADSAYAPVEASQSDYAVTYDANEDVMGSLETSDDYDDDNDLDMDVDLDVDDDDNLDDVEFSSSYGDDDYDYADVADYSPEPK